MKKVDLRDAVKKWSKKVGETQAHVRLVGRLISPSTVEKLIAGYYPSEPSKLIRSILLDEMKKDGFPLVDDKAS